MKKKVDQIDINNMNDKLAYKIFDLYLKDNEKFYIDKKMGWIWDKDKDVVGVIDKMNKTYFFDEIKIEELKLEDLIIS
jgi:hypothetical protein